MFSAIATEPLHFVSVGFAFGLFVWAVSASAEAYVAGIRAVGKAVGE